MKAEIVTVTPELAKEWLGRMGNNRTRSRRRAESYAQMMKHGDWKLTHQGIAFNCDGTLKDGQHRLEAVIIAGVPVKFWVFYGLTDDANLFIDTNRPRSDADAFKISGHEWTAGDCAVAKMMFFGPVKSDSIIDRATLLAFMEYHNDPIQFVHKWTKSQGASHASIRAVVARAYWQHDHERLQEFITVICTGMPNNPKEDSAAIVLRNWLQSSRLYLGGKEIRFSIYHKAQSAIRAFLERTTITKVYGTKEDLFPIPDFRT